MPGDHICLKFSIYTWGTLCIPLSKLPASVSKLQEDFCLYVMACWWSLWPHYIGLCLERQLCRPTSQHSMWPAGMRWHRCHGMCPQVQSQYTSG